MIKLEKIKISELKPYHLNCKKHNEKNIQAIKYSIKQFDQYKPLVVNKKTSEIIIGNGTFQALKQLNFEYATVVLLDLSQNDEKALNILDNKTSEISSWNENIIDKIKQFDQQLLNVLHFDEDFLKKFEKIEKINKHDVEKIEDCVILNESQNELLVSKQHFVKCPCCGKTFQIQ